MTVRVLVVDDLIHWADSIKKYSLLYNCEVHHAVNFPAAIKDVRQWRPQLILLDLHMPSDSWQPEATLKMAYGPARKSLAFCKQITSHPQLQDVIVVITSVENQAEHMQAGVEAGAFAFYTKPDFTVDIFEALLAEAEKRANPANPPP